MATNATTEMATNAAKAASSAYDKSVEFMEKNAKSPAGIAIQIIVGLIIIAFIYWISIKVLNTDALNNAKFNPNKKSTTEIIAGYADSSQVAHQSYNTVNTFASQYLPLYPSVNIKGGAQFTYSLWLHVGGTSASTAVGKPIFIRGDATKYWMSYTTPSISTPVHKQDFVAMCPLLEFGTNPMDFNVRFNTSNNINEVLAIQGSNSGDSIYRKNMMSMLQGQWFNIAIVFEDNVPINDFENGLVVKFYVNGVLYQSASYKAMLKQNTGNLVMFPGGSIDNVKISSFNYYNYALGELDIQAQVGTGPSTKAQSSVSKSFMQTLAMSDYNTMDIYNL